MSLSNTGIWETRPGGSDSANGGLFDPAQTSSMFTDGAATSATSGAPVFSSASYNFVSGDVGAWVYIVSGTNWIPGWYKISSVASNAATLDAITGHAVMPDIRLSGTQGCASTASPTSAQWTIDYSQQDTAQITYTDLASTGAGLTASSSANPFGAQQAGNSLLITGGTNFTPGRYVIASVSGGVATFIGPTNMTTGAGASGTGGLGGGCSTVATAYAAARIQNIICLNGTLSQSTALVLSLTDSVPMQFIGYGSVRGDGTFATMTTATNSIDLITCNAVQGYRFSNIIFSSTAGTPGKGIACGSTGGSGAFAFEHCRITGFDRGFWGPFSTQYYWETLDLYGCEIDHCVNEGVNNVGGIHMTECSVHDNGTNGALAGGSQGANRSFVASKCSFWLNGARGVYIPGNAIVDITGCNFADNVTDGLRVDGANSSGTMVDNIFDTNGGFGASFNSQPAIVNRNNAYRGNGSGPRNHLNIGQGDVTLTADPFQGRTTGDFRPNSAAGGGLLLKGAGSASPLNNAGDPSNVDIGAVQSAGSGGGGGLALMPNEHFDGGF